MKCRRCGAELLDTDTFCVKCGLRVDEIPRCPECGEELREGTRFCHKCGTSVTVSFDLDDEPEDDEIPVTGTKTVDIPFEKIERNIIMEAEQAVVKRELNDAEGSEELEKERELEMDSWHEPARKKFTLSGLMIIMGVLIVIFVAILAVILVKRNFPFYENTNEEISEEQEVPAAGKIQVIQNVNIRNYPATENSSILGVARVGEVYEFLELVNDAWYHIRIDDQSDGYVYRDYVKELQ